MSDLLCDSVHELSIGEDERHLHIPTLALGQDIPFDSFIKRVNQHHA